MVKAAPACKSLMILFLPATAQRANQEAVFSPWFDESTFGKVSFRAHLSVK